MCRVMRRWRTEIVMALLAGCMLVAAARTAAQVPGPPADYCNLLGIGSFERNETDFECEYVPGGPGCMECFLEITIIITVE